MLLPWLGLLCVVVCWHGGSVPFPEAESGQYIEVTGQLASQCGFTAGTDLRGNPQIRVSFLACSVHNSLDQEFSLQLQVVMTGAPGPNVPYDVTICCPLGAPWSPREIVCEENYMEVLVRRAVPGIASEALNEDWVAAWPVAQGTLNQVWQVVFHFQNGSLLSMPATQAHSLGYGVNTTATRVLFRAPYSTAQSERATAEGLEMEVARATVFYKQAWMILVVDTAVACPIKQYQAERVQMGLDGRLIDAATVARNGYSLLTDTRLILIVVPIGAPGGLMQDRGFDPHEHPNPNGTKAFGLRVPFADPLVQQQYLHGPFRRYTLHLNYTLRLEPTRETFTHLGIISCDIPDVALSSGLLHETGSMFYSLLLWAVPPVFQGSCEAGALALVLTHGTLDRFWVPYIGEQPLSQLAAPNSYQVSDDGHHFHLAVPLLAPGLAYESISLQGLTARLDFSFRDKKTFLVLASFTVVCTFPTGQLLVCLPNRTMVATVLSLDTRPALDPRRTHLRDPSCGPVAFDSLRALFSFSLASCGTTWRFEGGFLLYENEVTFVPEGIPATSPIVTRDSWYRLTLRCRYPLTETLWVLAHQQLPKEVVSGPLQPVG
ncbi:uncharacterized protein LOC142022395 [Carettochelys insculpta]|uniref:uncharacterized protein LOC142022395 n=1 Tax=Carettochelys insculpta TaxID=44489 RepID=UPI003EBA2252